jgi:putative phosphonate metabolism protein
VTEARPPHRVALYWAPEEDDPLHALGSRWLGRDAATGEALEQPAIAGLDLAAITAEPRGYGLHATLKPPFRLRCGDDAGLRRATAELCARTAPFELPPLAVRDLHGFLALRETAPCMPLQALCDAAVEALDAFRAPPAEEELARRRRAGLSPAQDALLRRWGYPYVFGEWFFHVTLTRRLTPAERVVVLPAVTRFLGDAPARPRRVVSVCLFTQAAPETPFRIVERLTLRG